ncbi:MAG: hypothetical protein WAP03_18625 [Methylorubrum rhodinum]|uniref:hypothetical protein n=1 Tax=Methylorubrum rhodinum TaxID=29428 RepID=UPI003BB06EB5
MPFLSEAQAAVIDSLSVRLAVLCEFDFVGEIGRYWLGFGPLRSADGRLWQGTGNLAKIDGLDVPVGTSAPKATFTLSGVDARAAALVRMKGAAVLGRDVRVLVQLYRDVDGGLETVEAPFEAWSGEMDLPRYDVLGEGKYAITVSAEGPWTARNKPPFGFYTDTDQQARFPGDRGLELVASLPGKAINWPV